MGGLNDLASGQLRVRQAGRPTAEVAISFNAPGVKPRERYTSVPHKSSGKRAIRAANGVADTHGFEPIELDWPPFVANQRDQARSVGQLVGQLLQNEAQTPRKVVTPTGIEDLGLCELASIRVHSRTFDAPERDRMYARSTRKYAKARELGRVLGQLEPESVGGEIDDAAAPPMGQSNDDVARALKAAIKAAVDADRFDVAVTLIETLRCQSAAQKTHLVEPVPCLPMQSSQWA